MIKTFEEFTLFANLEETMKSAADKLATIIFDEFLDWEFLKMQRIMMYVMRMIYLKY